MQHIYIIGLVGATIAAQFCWMLMSAVWLVFFLVSFVIHLESELRQYLRREILFRNSQIKQCTHYKKKNYIRSAITKIPAYNNAEFCVLQKKKSDSWLKYDSCESWHDTSTLLQSKDLDSLRKNTAGFCFVCVTDAFRIHFLIVTTIHNGVIVVMSGFYWVTLQTTCIQFQTL